MISVKFIAFLDNININPFYTLLGEEYFTRLRSHAFRLARESIACASKSCPLIFSQPLMEEMQKESCPAAIRE